MVALFRTNQSFVNLLLFGYALLLQLPVWLLEFPPSTPRGVSYYGRIVLEAVYSTTWLPLLLPPLLAATAGVLVNLIAARFRLSRTVTHLPGMAVVLLWALCPAFRSFDLHQLNFVFLCAMVMSLAHTYRRRGEEVSRFNAGFWLAAASLLVPAYLLFLPVAIIGIGIYRTASLRSILQLVGGMLTTYFLGGALAFWYGDFVDFYGGQAAGYGGWSPVPADRLASVGALLLAVPLLIVLIAGQRGASLLSIEGSKNVLFGFWLLLFSLPVGLLSRPVSVADAQVIVPFLGLVWGLWLARQREARAEFFHLLTFAAAILLSILYSMYGSVFYS